MLETLTVITLCILYLAFFRPGKTPVLGNPLQINRPGKYHVMLAPRLNLAQPFIEGIAESLLESGKHAGDSDTQYFEVKDKQIGPHDVYLLAITQRNGLLFFQAIAPSDDADRLQTLKKFSRTALAGFPPSGEPDAATGLHIASIARQMAAAHRIKIAALP